MTTFNEYLRTSDSDHARGLADDLDRHAVVIRLWYQMDNFIHDHPQYFRELTAEEVLAGLESVQSLWLDFERQRYVAWPMPLRQLGGGRFVR